MSQGFTSQLKQGANNSLPQTLFLEITTECDLKCKHCHMWLTKEEESSLTTQEKIMCVEQFIQINSHGDVVFTGGEPFLKPDEVLEISEYCRKRGVKTVTNSNGYSLKHLDIGRLISCGPDIIVFSLDDYQAEAHDNLRGKPGSYDAVTQLMSLLTLNRENGEKPTILVSAVLHEGNFRHASRIVENARDCGADGITFQLLERTFFHRGRRDKFFETQWFECASEAETCLISLHARYGEDEFFLLSASDIAAMKMYIQHPEKLPDPICGAATQNLVIDMYGEMRFCSYMDQLTGGRTLGNVRSTTLAEALGSDYVAQMQKQMSSCRRTCGALNCNRKSTW